MLIHNAQVTGSLILNGIDIGDITGSEVSIGALNSFSASVNIYTGSNNTNINALQTFSSSILTYTASNDTTNNTQNSHLSSLETTSGSLLTASGSFSIRVSNTETTSSNLTTASSSFSTRVANNESTGSSLVAASASFSTRVANTEATASSLTTASGSFSTRTTNLETASGSFSTRVTNAESSITSLNSKTGSYATTGSNTFIGAQTITGSLFITENLTVLGSSSISYVSQSTLNIGTNLITVNAQNPSIRFGGLAVIDSGSAPQVSGSWLFDSVQDRWIMIHQQVAGAALTSSIGIMGPETYNNLGSETTLTLNRLVKGYSGASGEHIGDSNISDSGTVVSINSNTQVTGSLVTTSTATFSSSVTIQGGNALFVNNAANTRSGSFYTSVDGTEISSFNGAGEPLLLKSPVGYISMFTNGAEHMRITSGGNVGIGTTSPGEKLTINGGLGFQYNGTQNWHVVSNSSNNLLFTRSGIADRMVITSDGDVGIGTTSPSLSDWSAAANGLQISDDTWAALKLTGSTGKLFIASGASANFIYGYNAVDLVFGVNNTEAMRIKSGGNVGIGTTSPSSKLQIRGDFETEDALRISSTYGTGRTYRFKSQGGNADVLSILELESTNRLAFFGNTEAGLATSGSTRLYINSGGNVGIGTTTILAKFQVKTGTNNNLHVFDDSGIGIQSVNDINTVYRPFSLYASTFVFNNGNVGIGTTSVNQALNLGANKNIRLDWGGGTDTTFEMFYDSDFRQGITFQGNARKMTIHNYSGDTDDTTITLHNGAVGIGTTSPVARLDLGSTTNGNRLTWANYSNIFSEYSSGDLWLSSNFYGNLGSSGYVTSNTATFGAAGIVVSGTGGALNGVIKFFVDNAVSKTAGASFTPTERMRIAGNGNVGIGTTNPTAKLTVNSSPDTATGTQAVYISGAKSGYEGYSGLWQNQLFVYDTSSTTTGVGGAISFGGNAGGGQTTWFGSIEGYKENSTSGDYGGALVFRTRTNGVPTPAEKLRITSTGVIQPGANGTQDLGTSSLRWATVYTSDLDMSNGIGDYTIVEGEEDLFLYNNKTNKVFKFVIQEVDPSEATPKMKK